MTLKRNWEKNIKLNNTFDLVLEKPKKYYQETAKDLLFTSDSLFTKKFSMDISSILESKDPNAGKRFKKMRSNDKKKVSSQLDSLLEIENIWKDLVSKSKYDSSKIKLIFPEELSQFIRLFNSTFYPPEKHTKHTMRKYGSEKSKRYFSGLYLYLLDNTPFLFNSEKQIPELTAEDLTVLVSKIEPAFLFQEIVKLSMKKAYDTNINIENNNPNKFHTRRLDTDFLQAKRTDLQYSVSSHLRIYLANILLNFLAARDKRVLLQNNTEGIIKALKHLHRLFKEELRFSSSKPEIQWFFTEPSTITMILLSMYQETDVIKTTFKEKSIKAGRGKNGKDSIIYVFNHKLDNSISFSHNLPSILPPIKADSKESIEDWLSPVKDGHSNIQVSSEALATLNIAQKKEFAINESFSKLLRSADSRERVDEFTTKIAFTNKKKEFDIWSNSVWGNTLSITLYKITRSILDVKNIEIENLHSKTADLCGLTSLECYANAKKNEVRSELLLMRSSRQLLLTSLDISRIYRGYSLFYGTKVDFRLRMYPYQYLISRTSGYLKNLLQESVPRTLTKKGMVNMLSAYYSPYPHLCKAFNEVLAHKKTFSSMKNFFYKNKIKLVEQPLYFELLEGEISRILQISSGKKTSLPLEIDQVGSGPTIIAMATGNLVLAEKCNLLPGPFSCIYTFLLEKAQIFLSEKNMGMEIDKKSNAYKLLTEDRKAQKFALMCFFYNQKHLGRTNRWKRLYEEKFGISPTNEDYTLLSRFSVLYSSFMEQVFPRLTKQLDLLNEASLLVISQGLPVKINTLDNCILSWDFDHTEEVKKNYYNPVSGTHDQYKLRIKVKTGATKNSIRSRKSKHSRSFLPNLVHSIDAAMMRMFIYQFYKKTGKKLNHLHDCVMLHPNDVAIFYEIVTDIYCSPYMETLISDLVFAPMKGATAGSVLEKIIEIEKEFLSNKDKIILTPESFDPKKCYRYEGAK